MSQSRYRESRTLVRRLCRLPREDRAEFASKISRLREHFERFNVDVAELCQWLLGLRKRFAAPDQPGSFGVLGDFMLEPAFDGVEADESERDRWRLAIFDDVAGIRTYTAQANPPLPEVLRNAMRRAGDELRQAVEAERSTTLKRLIVRLRATQPAHRLVLLKAAAEWIVARFKRAMDNWVRHHAEWEEEKREWETRHPALTDEVRRRYSDVFRVLNDPERNDKPGLRRKKPRICLYQQLRGNLNNCAYAGEKGHAPLCWKYAEFKKAWKAQRPRFNDKHFADDAQKYLKLRAGGQAKHLALKQLFPGNAQRQQQFSDGWAAYLRILGLAEDTVLARQQLPHCLKIGETGERSQCQWNPHTELCKRYKAALDRFDEPTLKLEPMYRAWRADYLAAPRKPAFRYPSSRALPMPKIFGAGFHEIDFDRSVLRLRLDDMGQGQWLEFGFVPWPRGYKPSRNEVKVTSVHVNFIGRRARAGFRFDAPHAVSRFSCTQDELDELRSRRFPRPAQDQQFLDAARACLLESFSGDPQRELRVLAVDLGQSGASAAVYHGRAHETDVPMAIVKINRLYTGVPASLDPDRHGRPDEAKRKFDRDDPRGVRKEHVGRHLNVIAAGASEIAKHRKVLEADVVTLEDHDFRGLKRHVAWMIRDWVRHNASQIIAAAEQHRCDLIVFESLRGYKAPGYDKLDFKSRRDKGWLAMFAFGRIRRKVVEKAVERGLRVVTAPYLYSSQVCSACGHTQEDKGRWRRNKTAGQFSCECGDAQAKRTAGRACQCTAGMNSDANAARVLARVFWGEITLPSRHDVPAEFA